MTAKTPLADHAGARRPLELFDIPASMLRDAVTEDFGTIATVGLKLLKPLEEKAACARAKSDPIQLLYELAQASIALVVNTDGAETAIRAHDGTLNKLWSQIQPSIRQLVMRAYSEITAAPEGADEDFLKSRRTQV